MESPLSLSARISRWLRRRLKRTIAACAVAVLLLLLMGVGAEYYTARPGFCGRCHVMRAYYQSWSTDVHGQQAGVACVDCHEPPGQRHTLKAKFRGLSQLASYFAGSSEAGRSRSRVDDGSCLTSGCHGDMSFLRKPIRLGRVTFTHEHHLGPFDPAQSTFAGRLAELRKRLTAEIGPERLGRADALASRPAPSEELIEAMMPLAPGISRDDVSDYTDLLRTESRARLTADLTCASCHVIEAGSDRHFAASSAVCHQCHFIGMRFDSGTGRCLGCHEVPEGEVAIHGDEIGNIPEEFVTVSMDHAAMIERQVDCSGCHSDVTRGSGRVDARDCRNCHHQERYLADFETRTNATIESYHRFHIGGHHAKCRDCHETIEHGLPRVILAAGLDARLQPVREQCEACHPDHHAQQVDMLRGQGGHVKGGSGKPNDMMVAGATCLACHQSPAVDAGQQPVATATAEACQFCHTEDYARLFDLWRESLGARMAEARSALEEAEREVAAPSESSPVAGSARELLARARRNIEFVRDAGGMHNRNYAIMLLEQAIADCQEALLPDRTDPEE